MADAAGLPALLPRVTRLLDVAAIPRDRVTLVCDKKTAALTNTVAWEEAGLGWVSALPWNQAPVDLRTCALETVSLCGVDHPGVRAIGQRAVVHGGEYLCVLQHSAAFASEQLLEELRGIQQVVLLYAPQEEKGPCRTASVLTKQSLTQQRLTTTLGLDRLGITRR